MSRLLKTVFLVTAALILASHAIADVITDRVNETSDEINAQIACQRDGECPDTTHFVIDDGLPFEIHIFDYTRAEISRQMASLSSVEPIDVSSGCAKEVMLQRLAGIQQAINARSVESLRKEYVRQEFHIRGVEPDFKRYLLFYLEPYEIEVFRETSAPVPGPDICAVAAADSALRDAIVTAAVRVNAYLAEANKGKLKNGARALQVLADNWSWFLKNGYSQYPWELGLNSLITNAGNTIYDLPTWQFVAVHPALGLEIDDDETSHAALLIEWVGVTRYWFDKENGQKNRYLSVSVLQRFREDRKSAWGGIVRYNKMGLGFTARKNDELDKTEWGIVATVDFYSLVQTNRQKFGQYKQALDQFRP